MTSSLIKHDAWKFAEGFIPNLGREQQPADYQAAYEEGARQVLRYLQQFAARANAKTCPTTSTSFQEGQVDGIFWAVDHISTLFGIE